MSKTKQFPGLSLPSLRLCVMLLIFALAPTPLQAQRDLKNIPDPDPEIERRSFQMAPGFEVNLFAADPLLAKPIQMNFDPQGRLWVACSEVYPQIRPGQKANDKVIVLEDTDGDGKADKTTVFADGLLIPTGVEPGDGGAYVADSTDLLHLRDTDGDGKADQRRIVLSGFGTEDTHHILHTLRWGPDGMLYFNQSIYIHSHIETPYGVRRLNAGGIWQFRPETMRLEVFARGFCNPWGHHFDRWGQSFATDGAYGEGINYVVPAASFVFCQPSIRILAGLNPGSPKHCGLEIVSGRHLPEDWQGNLITNDFRGHRVCRFVLSEDSSGYVSRENAELIKTNHAAFRPIDVKMGPDGAIYIADWYNPIIQHGEVDFRDPRRDLTHGRIWRITAKGRPLVSKPKLVGASTQELLEALKAPEDWTRQQAKRVLKERGAKEVQPALATWITKLDPADAAYEHHLLEALWTYQLLDMVEPRSLAKLFLAKDPRARAAAVRVLGAWQGRIANGIVMLCAGVSDLHPQVRLEAVRALAQSSDPRAVEVAMIALDCPMDKFLDYALWLTARDLAPQWLPRVQQGSFDFGGNVRHLIFALEAVNTPAIVGPIVNLVRAGKVPADQEERVLGLVATLGGAKELGMILEGVFAGDAGGAKRQVELLTAMTEATRQRNVRPAGDLTRLGKLLDADNAALRVVAARAAGRWRVEPLRGRLKELATAQSTAAPLRQAAFDGLASLGGPESKATLLDLSAAGQPDRIRQQAVIALVPVDLPAAARQAAGVLSELPEGTDPSSLFNAFAQQRNGANLLAKALADRKLTSEVAKVGVRTLRGAGKEAAPLLELLTKQVGSRPGPRVLAPAEMQQMVADVQKQGDPARGEAVFRRADMQCFKCHAIAGAGGIVGPDLVSIGASAQVDYLIESLLQPNKAIKENYHSLVVTTRDGRIFTGVKTRQTERDLVLRDAEDREVSVPIAAIEEQANGPSLMPEGLVDPLTRSELIDLVRFLSELGKVGPYAVGQSRTVRRWQALQPNRETYTLLSRTSFTSAAGNDPALVWQPAYSQVNGELPADSVPTLEFRKPISQDLNRVGFVRCQFEVTTAGRVRLRLNSASGVQAWLDGAPIETLPVLDLDFTVGLRTLTFSWDKNLRHEPLRCELEELQGGSARARVVGGK